MKIKWIITSLALLVTANCGRSQSPDGALGVITGEKNNSKSGENRSEPSSTKEEAANTEVSAYCLQGDCTAPASPTANINFASYSYFPGSQNGCQMGSDTVLLKSLQANRMTIFYRALYASVGRWQLYAQNVGVDAGGVMTPMGERVNLLPGCNGNTAGVVAFDVREYIDATGNSGARTFNLKSLERAAAVKVDITCVNAAQSASRTIDLSSLLDSDKSTVPFLKRDGAIGFWASKNVFIKADGTTLNSDGSAGSLVIPGYNDRLSSSGLPIAINDNSTSEASLTVSGSGVVTEKRVSYSIRHTLISDLTVTLVAPDGQTVVLQDRVSGTSPFTKEVVATFPSPVPFSGQWKLRVRDNINGDVGTLTAFGLIGSNISRVIGEDSNGIYIQTNDGNRYVTNNLSNASVAFGGIATGSFVAPDFGLFVTTQSSASAINFTRWQGNAVISQSNELYGMFVNGSGGSDVYGRNSGCIVYGSRPRQEAGADSSGECDYYSSEVNRWRSRLAPISRNQKTLLWHATAFAQNSCRGESPSYGCQLAVANLNNGIVSVVKVDRQALDFYNVDRGFFGGRWITERHDGDRGVIYLSNSYFD